VSMYAFGGILCVFGAWGRDGMNYYLRVQHVRARGLGRGHNKGRGVW
jgi:hypothetical protein